MQRRRVWLLVGFLATIILGGIVAGVAGYIYLVSTCVNPPDHVAVVTTNVPEDVRFVCYLSESKGQTRLMSWYVGEMFQKPVKVAPRITSFDYGNNDHARAGFVAWEPADRYGMLVKSTDGTWRVFWFPAAQVRLDKGSFFLSRGEARFDLSKVTAEPFSEDAVKALGFQQAQETPADIKP